MSDDLVKHLRNSKGWPTLGNAITARIEELEAQVKSMAMDCLVSNGQACDAYQAQLDAEAKLAMAVEALEFYATQDVTYQNVGTVTFHGHDDNGRKARATLAELTGGKDE